MKNLIIGLIEATEIARIKSAKLLRLRLLKEFTIKYKNEIENENILKIRIVTECENTKNKSRLIRRIKKNFIKRISLCKKVINILNI